MEKFTIFYMEDDRDDQQLLVDAFKETGYAGRLELVDNDFELLDYLSGEYQTKPSHADTENLILLDLNMPKMNGIDVLQRIKSNKLLKSIPVVIFSTSESMEVIDTCYQQGANSYIVKPFVYKELLETVREMVEYWFGTASVCPGK